MLVKASLVRSSSNESGASTAAASTMMFVERVLKRAGTPATLSRGVKTSPRMPE